MTNSTRAQVGVIALFHETNTFCPGHTAEEAFVRRWYVGEQLRDAFSGTRTVIGGFLDGAAETQLDVIPVFGAFATPAGLVTDDVMRSVLAEVRSGLESTADLDAVFVELHGALVADGWTDAEDALVGEIRDLIGTRPIASVIDFHANLRTARLSEIDILLGYRTNPHVDTYTQGRRAAKLLAKVLTGRPSPVRAHRGVPIISAPVQQRTDVDPMRAIMARANELEQDHGFLDVTVHGGYSYADVPHAGMAVSVTAEPEQADEGAYCADELVDFIWAQREGFRCELPSAGAAFAYALGAVASDTTVAVIDTGDNINGGTPGDATWLLHEAVRATGVRTLAVICDPLVVARFQGVSIGTELEVAIGGRTDPSVGTPVQARATLLSVGDGSFRNTGPMSTGAIVTMGTVTVLRIESCDVVVQQYPVQPNDPELFRAVGIDPTAYNIVLLKGAAAVRAGWQSIASIFVDAGTPGLTDSRLDRREYRNVIHPLWPLDQQ